jgi:hypothetical protein
MTASQVRSVKDTVSLPANLLAAADRHAARLNTNRSRIIGLALAQLNEALPDSSRLFWLPQWGLGRGPIQNLPFPVQTFQFSLLQDTCLPQALSHTCMSSFPKTMVGSTARPKAAGQRLPMAAIRVAHLAFSRLP